MLYPLDPEFPFAIYARQHEMLSFRIGPYADLNFTRTQAERMAARDREALVVVDERTGQVVA